MLHRVDVGIRRIADYRSSAGAEIVEGLRELAAPLAGARVLHVNATPYGGGVAEILRSEIPLLRDLGLVADWKIVGGDQDFFTVTKSIHNALQGAPIRLSASDWDTFRANAERNAGALEEDYDVVVVHDPQPLPLPELHGRGDARWVWRCHIDTSEPYAEVWTRLRPYLSAYDAAVFTLGGFVPPDLPIARVEIVPPAIDPESPKNVELGGDLARSVLRWIGMDLGRPFVAQVSRGALRLLQRGLPCRVRARPRALPALHRSPSHVIVPPGSRRDEPRIGRIASSAQRALRAHRASAQVVSLGSEWVRRWTMYQRYFWRVAFVIGGFLVVTYAICLAADAVVPGLHMYSAWEPWLIGVSGLSYGSWLVGTIELVLYALYAALILVGSWRIVAPREAHLHVMAQPARR